ncbi:inhibitor of vertebrate lysozyme family protein [Pseudomonas capsici]|uniref:Inhibitor of vertebrate lysozyme family protein n=1 Tax=Pseudomonas capsici TaxID=2810614 RepID=A0ABT3C177_9PSED|nr:MULTISPECIES: inhibitor of vertebrate lysozyme family protein [Pseudomonas]MBN6714627.1 inhibitor of vertebrate lysozyme family protein [Pseudomonas capsici]MBN6721617.1 inhibitor of vertebrate lysozyme family protein [Pseudomonas capsici]MBN6726615.1 inhibitor of vertebrate lysozyme family protein [Pseudomonas capsici]MBX8473782.1 inhibitor of vertebrate lysozyme family protein [Pseudomonas cichorii]MBX8607653.1 inhibitor of vertebrate lysozyme family protein [Pseudomonas cichorii]
MGKSLQSLAAALLMGGSAMALAANDGQARVNELLSSAPEYRQTWTKVVKKEERLPDWIINLSGASEQMTAVTEDGDPYLVGPLCETAETCRSKRLIVAFSLDKEDAYAMLVEVPAGLPADKSPTRHATYRFLGKPDEGMQQLLKEQLSKDPNWY